MICASDRTANASILARSCNAIIVKQSMDTDTLIKAALDMLKLPPTQLAPDSDIVFVSGVKDNRINAQFQMKFIQID